MNFSAQTSSQRTQEMIEVKLEKKRKNILGLCRYICSSQFRSGDYMSITHLPIIAMPGKKNVDAATKKAAIMTCQCYTWTAARVQKQYCVLESNNLRCSHRCTGWKTNDNICWWLEHAETGHVRSTASYWTTQAVPGAVQCHVLSLSLLLSSCSFFSSHERS